LGFSAGLVVAAGLLCVVVSRLDGRHALRRVPLMTVTAGVAALLVGWIGHIMLGDESVGIAVALVQCLVVGVISLVVVGAAAVLVDPAAARALTRIRPRLGVGAE
jgi:hypothetical protein